MGLIFLIIVCIDKISWLTASASPKDSLRDHPCWWPESTQGRQAGVSLLSKIKRQTVTRKDFCSNMSELFPPFQRGILSMYKISLFLSLVGVKAVETFPERSLPLSATQKKPQAITQDFKCFFQMWWGELLASEQRQWQDNFQRGSPNSSVVTQHFSPVPQHLAQPFWALSGFQKEMVTVRWEEKGGTYRSSSVMDFFPIGPSYSPGRGGTSER